MKTITFYLRIIVLFIIFALAFCGAFWLAKKGSYFFWYEDMVHKTIMDTVKQDALK